MKWVWITFAYVKTFVATLPYPDRMSLERRERAVEIIKRLAALRGWDTSVSDRCQFSPEMIDSVPRMSGVYRIHSANGLQYIGVSTVSLRKRLGDHLSAARSADPPNKGLADLIASGKASVEWYICPFAGWMEDYELYGYRQQHNDQPPPLNKRRRGGLV